MIKHFNLKRGLLIILFLVTAIYSSEKRYYNCKGRPIFYNNIQSAKIDTHKSTHSNNPKDIKLKNRLYGKWKKILKQPDGSLLYVTTIFYENGNFYTSAIRKKEGIKISKLYSKGKWHIKNSHLIEKNKNSNYAPFNSTTKDKIILITDKQFVYKTQNEKIFTYYRK